MSLGQPAVHTVDSQFLWAFSSIAGGGLFLFSVYNSVKMSSFKCVVEWGERVKVKAV